MKKQIDWLLILSVLYLALPNYIFYVGWLKPGLAVLISGVLTTFLWSLFRFKGNGPGRENEFRDILRILPFILLFLLFSGAGRVGFQNIDYVGSNALLRDLIEYDWPVFWKDGEIVEVIGKGGHFLVYYIAYYLPAALVGKLMGWTAANLTVFVWNALGLVIAYMWFLRLLEDKAKSFFPQLFSLACFLFSGGLDFWATWLVSGHRPHLGDPVQWWAGLFQYSSQTTLLFWVPQHCLAAWILIGILAWTFLSGKSMRFTGGIFALGILWSPFALVGCLPFLVLSVVINFKNQRKAEIFSFENILISPVLAIVPGLFIISNEFHFPLEFLPNTVGILRFFKQYIIFFILEVGIFAGLVFSGFKSLNREERLLLIITVFCLAAIPFFKMGSNNDFVMRASMPSLFILWAFVTKRLLVLFRSSHLWLWGLSILILVAGWFTGFSEFYRGVQHFNVSLSRIDDVDNFTKMPLRRSVLQRIGNPNSVFFRYLAK